MITTGTVSIFEAKAPAERPTKTKTLTTSDLQPNAEQKPAPSAAKRGRIITTGDFDNAGKYKGQAPEPAEEKHNEK